MYLLFHSFAGATGRRFYSDVVVNIAIYVPLGMSGFLAFRRISQRWLRMLTPVVLGGLLSACVEMTQLFTPSRECSTWDLINNVLGSALGVAAGLAFEKTVRSIRLTEGNRGDPAALALLFCRLAAFVFPFFPVIQLYFWRKKTSLLVHGPLLSPALLVSDAASWFAVVLMIRAARLRYPNWWIAFSVLLIPFQLGIVTRQPLPVDFIGAAAGILLAFCAGSSKVAPWLFLAAVIFRGLAPWHFTSAAQDFVWIPFGGFLNMEWQFGVQLLLEKLFTYGAAIWLLRRSGFSFASGMAIVCAVLAAIEGVQTHIPDHVAEITDPLLGLLAGLGLRALQRQPIGYHANS